MRATAAENPAASGRCQAQCRAGGVEGRHEALNANGGDNHAKNTAISMTSDPASYGFAGRTLDRESGLYYNRARMYDPSVGRFMSEDPIGFRSGDLNLYRYVKNNPIKYIDPNGTSLAAFEAVLVIAGATLLFLKAADWVLKKNPTIVQDLLNIFRASNDGPSRSVAGCGGSTAGGGGIGSGGNQAGGASDAPSESNAPNYDYSYGNAERNAPVSNEPVPSEPPSSDSNGSISWGWSPGENASGGGGVDYGSGGGGGDYASIVIDPDARGCGDVIGLAGKTAIAAKQSEEDNPLTSYGWFRHLAAVV